MSYLKESSHILGFKRENTLVYVILASQENTGNGSHWKRNWLVYFVYI